MAAPSLTQPEEDDLIRRWQQEGDEDARTKLVCAHGGFVKSCALKIEPQIRQGHMAVDLDDLIQAGYMGLMKALDRFDVSRGYKFISYAVHYIHNEMRLALYDSPLIRLPLNQRVDVGSFIATKNKMNQENNGTTSPEDDEVFRQLQQEHPQRRLNKESLLEAVIAQTMNQVAGDKPLHSEQGVFDQVFFDLVCTPPAPQHFLNEDDDKLTHILSILSPRRRQIITLRFGLEAPYEPYSLEEIGRLFNLSRERVRQIEAETIHILKSMLEIRGLTKEEVFSPCDPFPAMPSYVCPLP